MNDKTVASSSGLIYRPCVGLVIVNQAGLVWIGRRPDATGSPEGGGSWWQMPQGGIDPGETPEQAAKRELFEETGITRATIIGESPDWFTYDLPPHLHGKVWGGKYRGQRQKWFLMRFDGTDAEVNITPEHGEVEFDMWRWSSLDEAVELIVPFKRAVYEQVAAVFAPKIASYERTSQANS